MKTNRPAAVDSLSGLLMVDAVEVTVWMPALEIARTTADGHLLLMNLQKLQVTLSLDILKVWVGKGWPSSMNGL